MDEALNKAMQDLAGKAVTRARDEYGMQLDYSEQSIDRVETILTRIFDNAPKKMGDRFKAVLGLKQAVTDPREDSQVWGAYIGEVIRRLWGGNWAGKSKWVDGRKVVFYFVSAHGEEVEMSPVEKVAKRLTQGPDDSVSQYFKTFKHLYITSKVSDTNEQ